MVLKGTRARDPTTTATTATTATNSHKQPSQPSWSSQSSQPPQPPPATNINTTARRHSHHKPGKHHTLTVLSSEAVQTTPVASSYWMALMRSE